MKGLVLIRYPCTPSRAMLLVLKVGGSILSEGIDASLADDIVRFLASGSNGLVLVHGGGDEVTSIAERLGKPQTFIVSPEGIRSRYTDKETIKIFTMVMGGRINKEIVAHLQSVGLRAVGLTGIDGALLRAQRKARLVVVDERGRRRAIEGGYTGKIEGVDVRLLKLLMGEGYLPVIAPVALGREFEFLNVDGDRAAAYVAGALKADVALFLTDVEGVYLDGRLVREWSLEEARAALTKIGHGMEKKVLAAIEALEMGVGECIIASGRAKSPLVSALRHEGCTIIKGYGHE